VSSPTLIEGTAHDDHPSLSIGPRGFRRRGGDTSRSAAGLAGANQDSFRFKSGVELVTSPPPSPTPAAIRPGLTKDDFIVYETMCCRR